MNSLKIIKTVEINELGSNNVLITKNQENDETKKGILYIAINQKIDFYDENLEIVDFIDLQDIVSSIKFYNNFLLVGLLNSKVYIFDSNKDLYKTLYGHALPVTNIDVRNNLIFTIGADKMLKIWGIDFGDCRKSIISNESENIQFINEDFFIMGGTSLKYIQGFKLFHEKKIF